MRSVFRIIALIALAFPIYAQEKPSEVRSADDTTSAEFSEIVAFINCPTDGYNFTRSAGAVSRYDVIQQENLYSGVEETV